MAAVDPGGPGPNLYQLLGVPREASREDIAQAWRRRARAEHPDSRPGDAAAAGRFRALAGAWRVLGDPARRAAYDRALDRVQILPLHVLVAGAARHEACGADTRAAAAVGGAETGWKARPGRQGRAGGDEEEIRLAVLAGLALRDLTKDWDWPW